MWPCEAECRKKPEIDAEIELDIIKNTMALHTNGSVKVLRKNTGNGDNFQIDRMSGRKYQQD